MMFISRVSSSPKRLFCTSVLSYLFLAKSVYLPEKIGRIKELSCAHFLLIHTLLVLETIHTFYLF